MNSSTNNPRDRDMERKREEDEEKFANMAIAAAGAVAAAGALVAWGISSLLSTTTNKNNDDKNKKMMVGELIARDEFEDNPRDYFSKLHGGSASGGGGGGGGRGAGNFGFADTFHQLLASGGAGGSASGGGGGGAGHFGFADKFNQLLIDTTNNSSNNNDDKNKKIGVDCHPPKATRIVKWCPPLEGWIKCNTDGSSSSSSIAACGGLFRDCNGDVCGVFVQNLGLGSAPYAEFVAVVIAVEMAFAKGWRKIWFEMDSASTHAILINKDYVPYWKHLKSRWEKCLVLLESMEVKFSHIFRQGNVPADILANLAYEYEGFEWWDYVIPIISKAVAEDRVGKERYRAW